MQYSISELATEFDITTRTIRFYEEKGLLNPGRNGNTRFYSPADRTRLKLILRGKRLGFTLDESQSIIEIYDHDKGGKKQLTVLLEKIQEKRKFLEQQASDIEILLQDLDGVAIRCRQSLNKTTRK